MASDELKPYKPEARIMQTLASLAARKPLMELDALLEGRDRVSAQQVSFMLRGVGSAMSDYAFTLRQDFDAMRQRAEKAEREAERLLEEHDKAWRHAGMNLENLSAAVVRIDLLEDLLRDALFVFQVCASCQHGVLPKCRCEKCVRQRIDAALAQQAE